MMDRQKQDAPAQPDNHDGTFVYALSTREPGQGVEK